MNRYIKPILIVMVLLFGINFCHSQTTILNQTLLSQASFNTFTAFSTTGSQSWYFNSSYGAICNGYAGGQSFENEDWLVSPIMNLTQTDNVKLTFYHTRGNASVMNVGVTQGWYKVFATSDFTGNPATTQWTELTDVNQNITTAWQYVSSGQLLLPENVKSENSRIAFRYMSSSSQSATWEIKNVKVVGEPQSTNPNASIFKITNWNTEWLGCTTFGPTDENLQINNVVSAMLSINSDIYCIQEISNTAASPSIATIVSLLGSQWEGKIIPSTTDECDQRQAIIYKKARVQFVSSAQLSSGNASQGNSYYYNWSSGRYPAVYNVNLVAGTTVVPMTIVNIHAKAEDGNAMSYTRRLGAAEALKTILDGINYNTKNLMIIGDFNDYMVGTSSTACACSVSPYKNFVDDQPNYKGITSNMTDVHWSHPLIENIVISNEMFANYITNSVEQEVSVSQNISNYFNTTSNHLPVTAAFQFSSLGNQEYQYSQNNSLKIYPNPVKNQLTIDTTGLQTNNEDSQIYDLSGRQLYCGKINGGVINVPTLPSGIYILKVGTKSGRFVKE